MTSSTPTSSIADQSRTDICPPFFLFDKFIDGLAEIGDGLLIAQLDGGDDAVLDMILEDHLADVGDRRADRSDLDEDLAAVAAVFDHLPHGFQMPDGAGEAVEDGLGVFVHMAVALGVVVAVCVLMVVVSVVDVGLVLQLGDVMLVQIRVIVRMLLCHEGAPYLIS